jgi:hypothetical protein
MKKIFETIFFILFIIGGYTLFFYFNDHNTKNLSHSSKEVWKTYQKDNKHVKVHLSTPKELQEINVYKQQKRIPSSVKKPFTYKNRIVKTNNLENYNFSNPNFIITNKINPNWKKNLARKSLRFQKNSTKLYIKNEHSFLLIKKNKARYVEQVSMTYLFNDKRVNSATALVDSDTGEILKIWNRTKHENRHKSMSGASKLF